jgi:hypothetical protein
MTAELDPPRRRYPERPDERARVAEIAVTIKQQIGPMVLMSLGAHNFLAASPTVSGERGGLDFAVRVLPMRADGKRGTAPRIMRCRVTLTAMDDYKVRVAYLGRGKSIVTHFETDGVFADQLPNLLLALDFDGDTVLNPRLATGA